VLGIEVTTRMCATAFFDPVPGIWHILLVGSVPAANLLVWLALRGIIDVNIRVLGAANGIAIGVSAYYTVLFLPMLPLALIGVLWLIGLLPMAPLFSLLAALRMHFYLKQPAGGSKRATVPGTVLGLMIFAAVIVTLEARATVTRLGMQMAASSESDSRRSLGIRLLRAVGDEGIILRSCYRRTGRTTDLMSMIVTLGDPVPPKKSRRIYYRVTGVPFNAAPPPVSLLGNRGLFRGFGFDPAQGEQVVAGRIRGLSLTSSRIDGSVDGDAALAYLEWTLVFRNDSSLRQEARARISLPPGGVVSRLTLWIDGEEREAVFARRAKVTKAYRRIVRRSRDPVLVTTCGPDRVLVQCFPVERNGGTMKLRLGITCPLVLPDNERGILRLPRLVERNFSIPRKTAHLVWVESTRQLSSHNKSLKKEDRSDGLSSLRGALSDGESANPESLIFVERSPAVERVWTKDLEEDQGKVVLQTLIEEEQEPPERVVIVIDGSAGMLTHGRALADALSSLPRGLEFAVAIASDEVVDLTAGLVKADPALLAEVAERAARFHYRGGCDNVPALARAWDMAAGKGNAITLWIHAAQPTILEPVELLVQRYERRPEGPRLHDFEVFPGPNRIIEKLDRVTSLQSTVRRGNVKDDLKRVFSGWRGGTRKIAATRSRIDRGNDRTMEGWKKTSDHLARLWAHDRIAALRLSKNQKDVEEAVRLAAIHKLVTPLTGAVVLETRQDYERAGLTPPEAHKVPTIPEPETWILIIVSLAGLAWIFGRRRTQWAQL